MEKDKISATISKDTHELVKTSVDSFEINRSALIECLIEFGLKERLAEFMTFFTNGYEVRDGRYKDGVKQD